MPENNPLEIVNFIMNNGREAGVAQQVDEGRSHDGRTLTLQGKSLIHFGSCGYMGLEFDPGVRKAAQEAIRDYGVYFSSSRTYLSNPNYPILEDLLEKILGRPTLVTPTTTLLHLAALPVLIGPEDVVLLDQQVHSSVQLAAKVLKADGVQVDILPHNNPERIERKIKAYKDSKSRIWFLGDGIYSMYGDFAPVKELSELLKRHEQFHVYLDDAHGMSWTGRHGRGYVLENMEEHERLYVVVGLAKGFGAVGGAIACPTREVKQTIRNCGGTQTFSGPISPPMLAAAVASARIHLDPEYGRMQRELVDRIHYMNKVLEKQPLPLLSATDSPIRFLGVGEADKAEEIVKLLIEDGFWLNIARYPAVGPHHAGLRFMLTRKIGEKDIELFGEAVQRAVDKVFGGEGDAIPKIWRAFKKEYRFSLVNG